METIALRIICIGNILHGNDGVGHQVFKRLSQIALPDAVELLDGGIGGLSLLPICKGASRLLFIDLMKSEQPQGSVVFIRDALNNLPVNTDSKGEHGGDLTTLLTMLPVYLEQTPDVDLLCISASDIQHYTPLIDQHIKDAIDRVCLHVEQTLSTPLP